MNRIHRFTQTCDITSAPLTGESGTQVVATDHLCTVPYPASRETRMMPGLDTIVALYEMQCLALVTIENDATLFSNGRTFNILRAQQWQPTSPRRQPFYFLILEETAI